MKNTITTLLLLIPLIFFAQKNNSSKKVLMVLSSYGKDEGATRPGYEFDEFSQAYLIFKNNNLTVDIASPKGGKIEADKYNTNKAYNKAIIENKDVLQLLENTIPTSSINPEQYDAIYVVGGKGSMFDLPYDSSLQDIILNLYNRKKIVASVCHGSAAFVNIKNDDDYIIKNEKITGFCNEEEALFGKKWVKEFPFQLEDKLKSRGAQFVEADPMLSKVTVSGLFVTGQNPFSTTKSAEEVVKALGITPTKRTYYKDENSIYLVQDFLDKNKTLESAKSELKSNHKNYDIELIAVYAYYKILAANNDTKQLQDSVNLIELTSPYFFNENLQFKLAQTHITLKNNTKAKEILKALISKDLLKEKAEELLKEIS